MSIIDSITENLQAEGLLQLAPRTHLVLGFSAGADSTALLYLLHEIRQKHPLDVTAAYVNHGWRGMPPEELPLIHRHCLETQTPLVIIQADRTLPKTENAARQYRYRQLTQLAQDLRADAVLTAHHADDQVETLLFRLFRGTGIDGLSGIQKRLILNKTDGAPIPILRPLLDISRKNIREYLAHKNLSYFRDPTNEELKIQRNNIRHRILPLLEESFPQVKNALFRLCLVAEGDLEIVEEVIQNLWPEVYGVDKQGPYLQAIRFNQLGLPYQRRVLKRFLAAQQMHPDFQTIEDLLLFIRGEGRRNLDASLKSLEKTENGKTRFLQLYKDRLRLVEKPETPALEGSLPVNLPSTVTVPSMDLTFKAVAWQAPDKVRFAPIRPNDNRQVFVDLSAFADKPLELRTRRPGDKFQPMGMAAPLRFKKFLINRGVPRFERDRLVVLASGNQILWAPGLGISQTLRLKDDTPPTHYLRMESAQSPFLPEPAIIVIEPEERRIDSDDDDDTREPIEGGDLETDEAEDFAEEVSDNGEDDEAARRAKEHAEDLAEDMAEGLQDDRTGEPSE